MKKPRNSILIAIAGGIGSGKSVVCRMLGAMGYPVYDCDSRARALMDADKDMQLRIAECLGEECMTPDGLDRGRISDIVFADNDALAKLNAIVHGAVRTDIDNWADNQVSGVAFVETAIPYQSGIDKMVDAVWEVEAPTDIRIRRVIARNNMTAKEVRRRIEAQDSFTVAAPHPATYKIINDGDNPLLPQLITLLTPYQPTH